MAKKNDKAHKTKAKREVEKETKIIKLSKKQYENELKSLQGDDV